MSYFAKVENGIVTKVLSATPEFFKSYVDTSAGEWIQTSYNTKGGIHYDPNTGQPSADQSKAIRKNYAGIGYSYDQQRDAFIPPQPYPSWTLDEQTCLWNPPVAMPRDDKMYRWDEDAQNWVVVAEPTA